MAMQAASDFSVEQLGENLRHVRERIAAAAERAGRDPRSVRLVGVSKTFRAEAVIAAVGAGLLDIGENRVQEAAGKAPAVAAAGCAPVWHLIGHLQSNKVNAALDLFSVIESVDSVRLAETLSRRAQRPIAILLEVNIAGESTKTGFEPDAIADAVARIRELPNLVLEGLMTVAPAVADPEAVRPVFRRLRELSQEFGLRELSMGMSGDYEVAVGEGATIVRVGRAIFGARA